MIEITDTSQLGCLTDDRMVSCIQTYIGEWDTTWAPFDWREFGKIYVFEHGDGAICPPCPPFISEIDGLHFDVCYEWLEDKDTFFELSVITCDAGDFYLVLIPKKTGIDARLLAACQTEILA
ncbi:hypothetical protein KSF73_01345 [Burkholderiaceae bacterium DAT-1]|nr:hypothetical protein [Burkholderiaceae bacterium DAT-1]